MTAPEWIQAVVRDFGRGAGLSGFELNESGSAALSFESGVVLRMEYTGVGFVVAVTLPGAGGAGSAGHLLALAHPKAKHGGFRVRTGVVRGSRRIAAIMIPERDVTLPRVNAAFAELWRIAGELGEARWA
ncbi:MAG: hypothetical protein IKD42_01730 [Kiritimatiellae bacterium]|nr:hypothetical protein [Kiritimatiellia bacterium]